MGKSTENRLSEKYNDKDPAWLTWLWLLIKETLRLDVADLNYLYLPHNIEYMVDSPIVKRRPGISIRIGSFFVQLIKSVREPLLLSTLTSKTFLFFCHTKNQERALQPLVANLPDSNFVGMYGFGQQQLPVFWAYVISIPFLPLVVGKLVRAKRLTQKAYLYVFDDYWLTYGSYILMRSILRINQPTMVIVANDHSLWARTFVKAAKDEDIPTTYIQHASVTERFPALNFEYALLEGQDAAEKYAKRGSSTTKVFLIGIPRLDKYYHAINNSPSIQKVGVCVGLKTTLSQLIPLSEELNSIFPLLQFTLRPHPGDLRYADWKNLAARYRWKYSDATVEASGEFLSHVDFVISEDSNVLLEAVLMNIEAVCYDFSGENTDWYGFRKNKLVKHLAEPKVTALYLRERLSVSTQNVRMKAKRYCATVDTKYDGHSLTLALNLLRSFAKEDDITNEWELVIWKNGMEVFTFDV